ncbi:hypothetical protein J3R30DRAFT_3501128 [Lentinula aciculospora]|uniref:non-specific serine/threonine protein kinase n=1 Tax=Lentinula aciculospora TaxID=153920 RepID=A0A9W9A6F6_9AGAR|nr:hypothetical protein J3R30DRAFT_3501128 [Lentinula aciculospora]
MLLRKPTRAGGSPTPSSTRLFSELDGLSSVPPPPPPVPVSPQSKTHAFFSSPFSTTPSSPVLPSKRSLMDERNGSASVVSRYAERATPPRSLTADFFSTNTSLVPPPESSPVARRNFLNLELNGDNSNPVTLTGAFASTPTPTEPRDDFDFIRDNPPLSPETRHHSSTWTELPSEPTPKPPPKPPSLVFNHGRDQSRFPCGGLETLPSSSTITALGSEPDAEVLSTSPSFSHLPLLGLTAAQGLSAYPSRPTSSHSLHSAVSQVSQELSASVTHSSAEMDVGESILHPAGEEELASGMIIRSFLPSRSDSKDSSGVLKPLSVSTASSNSSTYSNNTASISVTLRLSRALGQGTFSSVWLAEDLSPTSLMLRSKKSLKDLKKKSTLDLRKADLESSGRGSRPMESDSTESERKNGKIKSSLTTTSSLMRRLRGGVSGTRPGGASASSAKRSTDDSVHVSVTMGRQGTLMPSPAMPSTSTLPTSSTACNGPPLDLPLSLIPGHPSSSTSPPPVSSRTLGLGLPIERDRLPSSSSARSVYLEFTDEPSGARSPPLQSPPMSPNSYTDRLSMIGLDVPHRNFQDSSISRASSISWKSSASSDEGHDGGTEDDGVRRNSSTRSNFSTRSHQNGSQRNATSRRSSTRSSVRRDQSKLRSRLVAVKLTSRGVIEERERLPGQLMSRQEKREEEERARERDRTRVSFVREVEVMKHISHPNITPLLSHLTTRTHHVLVLPYLPGGDLLGLVNDENIWNNLGERALRRIFSELCKAVGWLHGVGLVHRDIKLENILLTVSLDPHSLEVPSSGSTVNGLMLTEGGTTISPTSYSFPASSKSMPASPTSDSYNSSMSPPPTSNIQPALPTPPQPLIKLTDFGLSRFIDPANPLLTTRCGSEAYAAPELVVSGGRAGVASSAKSPWFMEDGAAGYAHENDSESENAGGYDARETDAWACGVVLYALVARRLPFGEGPGETLGVGKITGEGGGARGFNPMERRQWLMKIARGEWHWPETDSKYMTSSELRGLGLSHSIGAKRAVGRLLVRDPSRRARVKDLWNDDWLHNFGTDGGFSDSSIDGLSSGTDSYSPFMHNISSIPSLREVAAVSSRLSAGVPNSFSPTSSALPHQDGRPLVPDNYSTADDEEEFDNDRRENQENVTDDDDDAGSPTADEEDELEDEEEDGEGWLVDKDSINHIARSEVPR